MGPRSERIAWRDGMLLLPQHLQYQDQLNSSLINRVVGLHDCHHWGIRHLDIDLSRLAEGTFAIRSVEVVLPGIGLLWQYGGERPVVARELGSEDSVQEPIAIYLAVRHSTGPMTLRSSMRSVADLEDEDSLRQVEVLHEKFEILVGDEERASYHSIRIARVARRPNGALELAPDVFPPALRVFACPHLVERLRAADTSLRQLTEVLRGECGKHLPQANVLIPILAVLHTRYRVQLEYDRHPFDLWSTLVEVIAVICAGETQKLTYRHEDLSATFAEVFKQLAEAISPFLAQRQVSWTFESRNRHSLRVELPRGLTLRTADRARLIFRFPARENVTAATLAGICKFSHEGSLDERIDRALPGVPLRPSAAAASADERVLEIDCTHDLWTAVATADSAGLFIPPRILERVDSVVLEVFTGV